MKTIFSHYTYRPYILIIYTVDTVSAMAFGKLGQEDHVLILVTNGNLNFFQSIYCNHRAHKINHFYDRQFKGN